MGNDAPLEVTLTIAIKDLSLRRTIIVCYMYRATHRFFRVGSLVGVIREPCEARFKDLLPTSRHTGVPAQTSHCVLKTVDC